MTHQNGSSAVSLVMNPRRGSAEDLAARVPVGRGDAGRMLSSRSEQDSQADCLLSKETDRRSDANDRAG